LIRCPNCGHMVRWSRVAIKPCDFCHEFLVMPDEATAVNSGVFTGVIQPYHWSVDEPEAILILDGLEALMDNFQLALQGEVNDEALEALSGSFVYAKQTRNRLRNLVPDLHSQVEKR